MSTTPAAQAAQTTYRYGVRVPDLSTSGSTSRAYDAASAVTKLINEMSVHLSSLCTCGRAHRLQCQLGGLTTPGPRCRPCREWDAAVARLRGQEARLVHFADKDWFYYPELPQTGGQAAQRYADRNGVVTVVCLTGHRRVNGGDGPEDITEVILRVDTGAGHGSVRLYLAVHRRTVGGWAHATPLMPAASFHDWDGTPRYNGASFYEPAISGWLDQVADSDPARIGDFTDPIATTTWRRT